MGLYIDRETVSHSATCRKGRLCIWLRMLSGVWWEIFNLVNLRALPNYPASVLIGLEMDEFGETMRGQVVVCTSVLP